MTSFNSNNTGAILDRTSISRTISNRSIMPNLNTLIKLPFIKNQSPMNEEVQCCVSAAISVCMEYLEASTTLIELSMLYHYYYAASADSNRGMTLSRGLYTSEFTGICNMNKHSYVINFANVRIRPSSEARYNGEDRIVESFSKLHTPLDIQRWKDYLDNKLPLILIFHINNYLYHQIPANNDTHPPLTGSRSAIGHAVVVVGYDNQKQVFIIQDCRGEDWCNEGKWMLPFTIASSANFTNELCVIKRTSKGEI